MRHSGIEAAAQRLVMCQLMLDVMRSLHVAYAPPDEPFGTRMECFFVAICITLGDLEGKPFSTSKIAAYMNMPRTTAGRRLDRLCSWGLVKREGHLYFANPCLLNSLIGMRSYKRVRCLLNKASDDLSALDAGTLQIYQGWPAWPPSRLTGATSKK